MVAAEHKNSNTGVKTVVLFAVTILLVRALSLSICNLQIKVQFQA